MLTAFSALGIFLMAALIFVSVFFRYFLGTPIHLTEDLTTYLLGLTVFAAYPGVTFRREHIRVDLLSGVFAMFPRFDLARRLLIDVISIVILAAVSRRIWEQAERAYSRGSLSSTMEWPLWPAIYVFAVLLALSTFLYLIQFLLDLKSIFSNKELVSD